MDDNIAKQKSKYTKMIIVGFAGPILLLISTLLVFAGLNFVLATNTPSSSTNIAVANIANTFLLVVGIVAASGFIWGPIIGIIGIVKLSELNKNIAAQPKVPANAAKIEQTAEEEAKQ